VKKDKYLKARGGEAHMIDVSCAYCGQLLLYYQKDGPGWLKRCYLNRIFGPAEMEKLQHNPQINSTKNLSNLKCHCGETIGYPMIHKDGRLAFRLEKGKFSRKRSKNQNP
jgi:hypothetical protein